MPTLIRAEMTCLALSNSIEFNKFLESLLTMATDSGTSHSPMQHVELQHAFVSTHSFKIDKVKPFILSSGRPSEFYVNCKQLLSHPKYRLLIAELIYDRFRHILDEVELVGGMEIGAIPIASIISDYYYQKTGKEIRTFVVRKKAKEHGLGLAVEGDHHTNDHALIVDDVLTTGKSTMDAIENARVAGLTVRTALVLVDRGEDSGKENLEKIGVKLLSLLTLNDLKTIQNKTQTPPSSSVLLSA